MPIQEHEEDLTPNPRSGAEKGVGDEVFWRRHLREIQRLPPRLGAVRLRSAAATYGRPVSLRPQSGSPRIGSQLVHDAFCTQACLGLGEVVTNIALRPDPVHVPPDTLGQCYAWLVAG